MPSAAEGENGMQRPSGGIKIASLLHLAAINRENERSGSSNSSAKAAPLKDVLNQEDPNRRLVPLSLIAPQLHDDRNAGFVPLASVLDPQIIALSEPSSSASNKAHDGLHEPKQVRLPGIDDITKRPPKPGKAGVPLAEVLNEESRSPHLGVANPSSCHSPVSSSGNRKRRKLSNAVLLANTPHAESARPGEASSSSSKYYSQGLTLPRLPVTSARGLASHGLPPVITGLYDPPEETRVIPSIDTGDGKWQPLHATRPTDDTSNRDANLYYNSVAPRSAIDNEALAQPSSPTESDLELQQVLSVYDADEAKEASPEPIPEKKQRKSKAYRKWSKDEAANLERGVKEHGIGSWKQILEDEKLHFHADRTAVDLKDRFRRTHPEQYEEAGQTALAQRQTPASTNGHATKSAKARRRRDNHQTATADRGHQPQLEQVGSPQSRQLKPTEFPRAGRRGRVRFSSEEDNALRRGYDRHGTNWQNILVDSEFSDILSARRRTDLRDRFRNKWPEEFKAAKTGKDHMKRGEALTGRGDNGNEDAIGDSDQRLEVHATRPQVKESGLADTLASSTMSIAITTSSLPTAFSGMPLSRMLVGDEDNTSLLAHGPSGGDFLGAGPQHALPGIEELNSMFEPE